MIQAILTCSLVALSHRRQPNAQLFVSNPLSHQQQLVIETVQQIMMLYLTNGF